MSAVLSDSARTRLAARCRRSSSIQGTRMLQGHTFLVLVMRGSMRTRSFRYAPRTATSMLNS